jgi:two-component sensor histidine kinase
LGFGSICENGAAGVPNRNSPKVSSVKPQIPLPEAVASVFITEELERRAPATPDYLREKLAIQELAQHLSDKPDAILSRLVKLAMDICDADSSGISIFEPEERQFRWYALSGQLATFEGATTPRDFSPCGVCLDVSRPILMAEPERVYDWIRDAHITVPEVLLVPLMVKDMAPIGTLWIVAGRQGHFHQGHARVMTELAGFAGIALRMVQSEARVQAALEQQELLAREMSHGVKNLFAIADAMVHMTARTSASKEDLTAKLSGRFRALADAHALVRRSFGNNSAGSVNFGELIERILLPHNHVTPSLAGPAFAIGEQATSNLALIFHELTTNAVKYGALSKDSGTISVFWETDGEDLKLLWKEVGGPVTALPVKTGFGSSLVSATVERLGGQITYDWRPEGLSTRLKLPLLALRS